MAGKVTEHSMVCAIPGLTTEYLEDGEAIIQPEQSSVHYGLNSVGGRVWSLIQHPTAVKRVYDVLLLEYDVDQERCMQELLALLNDLVATDLATLIDGAAE
jgi:hypothetical protein